MKTYSAVVSRVPRSLPATLRRRKPRSYLEWKTLHDWRTLPAWEDTPPGYLLRLGREDAGLTQHEMGVRLASSQQAIAQAERWNSNPTIRFIRDWLRAVGRELVISIESP